MNTPPNQQVQWQIEDGLAVTVITFVMLSAVFSYASWYVHIPWTHDPSWIAWNLLPKAILHYVLSLIGIHTQTWVYLDYVLQFNGAEKLFRYHFYAPLIVACPIAILVGYFAAAPRDKFHVSGKQLLSGRRAIRFAKAFLKANAPQGRQVTGLLIHPEIRLNQGQENKGLALIGSPGAGKTQNILLMLMDAIDNQPHGKFLILDNKGDFTALFTSDESVILAPWDARSLGWDIGRDIVTELDAGLFASSTIAKTTGDNSVFVDAAQIVLTGFIICLQRTHGIHWGWHQLAACLEWSTEKMIAEFGKHYPIGLHIIKGDSKTSDSVIFTMATNLAFIRYLAQAWPQSQGCFSLRDWLDDQRASKRIFLLQVNKAYPSLSDPFCCAVLSCLTQLVLSPELPDSSTRRLHFVLDEIAQIPRVEQLKNLSALGRSKGACVWLGVQDFDLLVKNYGQQEVNALIGMLQTQIILQMGAGPGAEFASRLLNERDIYVGDLSDQSKDISLRTEKQRLVTSSEINALPSPTLKGGIHGWLAITGCQKVFKLNWPIQHYHAVRKGVVLADWVKAQTPSPTADAEQPAEDAPAAVQGNPGKKRLIKKTRTVDGAQHDEL